MGRAARVLTKQATGVHADKHHEALHYESYRESMVVTGLLRSSVAKATRFSAEQATGDYNGTHCVSDTFNPHSSLFLNISGHLSYANLFSNLFCMECFCSPVLLQVLN